jgi:hypothetical protein
VKGSALQYIYTLVTVPKLMKENIQESNSMLGLDRCLERRLSLRTSNDPCCCFFEVPLPADMHPWPCMFWNHLMVKVGRWKEQWMFGYLYSIQPETLDDAHDRDVCAFETIHVTRPR